MKRIGIVGAGIAGLTAARLLSASGHDVTVWDKGRRPGGRASSRRSPAAFDHGAQYFTARDPRFRAQVDEWRAAGVVAPWNPRIRTPRDGDTRFVGVPGMNAAAEHLARGLDVRSGVRIADVTRNGTEWLLRDDSGVRVQQADTVLITTPPAQAVPLLSLAPDLAARAAACTLQPCWAVMLEFNDRLPVDFDAAFVRSGPLSWVARNSSKPGRAARETWVLHASAAWSREHLEEPKPSVIRELVRAFFHEAGTEEVRPEHADAHRWRFAIPDNPYEDLSFHDPELDIGVGGDWCAGARIEGAYLSGRSLAEAADRPVRPASG
ncbi:MAG: FAD-dependent oxidoreductase [Gemmatimonadetes bacterium]|nr:FAD-dependent oxidoreductase [Gemmatimonadota bacterium]